MAIVLSTLMLLVLFGGLGGALWYVFKIANAQPADTSISGQIETAQEFLPFQDIGMNMVDLGNHQYRMYIEVSSINYFLRTEEEKNIIELSYQRFLNSLSHPITLFVQTRVANSQELLAKLKEDYTKTFERYPSLEQYAEMNYKEMVELYHERGTDREKRKYIIVPFDEAIKLTEFDDDGKREYAEEELYQRCRILMEGLSGIGLQSHILDTFEIAELIFSTYHKQNYAHFNALIDGDYTDLILSGRDRIQETSEEGRIDWVLYEAQMKLQQEVFTLSPDEEIKKRALKAIREVELIRNALAQQETKNETLGGL